MENNIEEDIEIVKEIIELFYEFPNPQTATIKDNEIQALENILSDRERLLKENEELKEYIIISPNLDEMTATKYSEIQKEGYLKGRAEEQQKAEQIINEKYISKQIIKEEIRSKNNERQFELQQKYKDFKDDIRLNTLQEIYYMFVEDK